MLSRITLRYLRLLHSPHATAPAPYRSITTSSIPQAERNCDHENAGHTLAKLSKVSQTLRQAIQDDAASQANSPELLVQLEQEVDEATKLIEIALDKAGRPCTAEQLADRIDRDVVPIPGHALDYKQLLHAEFLRDQIEDTLVSLQVLPPKDTLLGGTGRKLSKAEKKASRKGNDFESAREEVGGFEGDGELTELRHVNAQELARRKAHMENATKMENVLRGYHTALLEVARVHKVVKGGTTMSMRALVAIGNRNGVAGYGEGKSDNAQHAIERACRDAKRNLLYVGLHQGRTITHRAKGSFVRSRVDVWPAPRGTGISANNSFAAIFQLFGLKDVGAKLHGPRSLSNGVKALFNALSQIYTADSIAEARGLSELTRPQLRSEHEVRGPRLRPM